MHDVNAKGILSAKGNMNIYRGCTHGCIYCDSRSRCYRMDHAFEDVEVKQNAVELLEATLRRRRKKCMIGTGSMTDPYLPTELQRGLLRGALAIIEKYGFGFSVLTKSTLVLRDLDLLQKINEKTKCVVQMTLTTFDDALCKIIEPNVPPTSARLETLRRLRAAGIPTVVWLCPTLPFINDTPENLRGLLDGCASAGVYGIVCFGMGLTLREGSRDYFYAQLDRNFPGLKAVYQQRYGNRYVLTSPNHTRLMRQFHETCARQGIVYNNAKIFAYLNAFEEKTAAAQLCLFPSDDK